MYMVSYHINFEKKTNHKKITDLKISPYERCVTFDGDDIFSAVSKLKSP